MQLEVAKLLKSRDLYGARSDKASEKKACMKPAKREASEKEKALKAVYKRLEARGKKKDEARSEEAAERRTQQECI